jgi:hypothetical protein
MTRKPAREDWVVGNKCMPTLFHRLQFDWQVNPAVYQV